MWEEQKPVAHHAVVSSAAAVEPMEEDKEEKDNEVDMGEGPFTKD